LWFLADFRPVLFPNIFIYLRDQRTLSIVPLIPCYDFAMSSSGTMSRAEAFQIELLRRMSGEERMAIAFEMTEFGWELVEARIRSTHPEWTDAQVRHERLRIAFLPHDLPSGFAPSASQ
jgi:hypothetical protein